MSDEEGALLGKARKRLVAYRRRKAAKIAQQPLDGFSSTGVKATADFLHLQKVIDAVDLAMKDEYNNDSTDP